MFFFFFRLWFTAASLLALGVGSYNALRSTLFGQSSWQPLHHNHKWPVHTCRLGQLSI